MAIKKKIIDRIFMIIFVVLGFLLFVISAMLFSKLSDRCQSRFYRAGLMIVMVAGASLFTIGFVYAWCNYRGECYIVDGENSDAGKFYLSVCGVISVCLTLLLGVMGGELEKDSVCGGDDSGASPSEKSDGKVLKFFTWALFGVCFISSALSISALYYSIYVIPGTVKERSDIQQALQKKEKEESSGFGGFFM